MSRRGEETSDIIPGINTKNAVFTGANLASNLPVFGRAGNAVGGFVGYLENEYAMQEAEDNSAKALGASRSVARFDSPAFRHIIDEMKENKPTETLWIFGGGAAGGAAGAWLGTTVGLPFGGLIGGLGGGIAGSMLTSNIVERQRVDFEQFAKGIDQLSQQGQLTGEHVFVARLMSLPKAHKSEINALLKAHGFKNMNDLVEALQTEQGTHKVNLMMHHADDLIRESVGINGHDFRDAQGHKIATSQILATYYNSSAAVDLATGIKGANIFLDSHIGEAVANINQSMGRYYAEQKQAQQAPVQADDMTISAGNLPPLPTSRQRLSK